MKGIEKGNSSTSFYNVKTQKKKEQNKNNSTDISKYFYTFGDICIRIISCGTYKKIGKPSVSSFAWKYGDTKKEDPIISKLQGLSQDKGDELMMISTKAQGSLTRNEAFFIKASIVKVGQENQVHNTVSTNSVKVLHLLDSVRKSKYKVAISGATSGVGKILAQQLGGCFVPVGGRNNKTLAQVAESANELGYHLRGSLFEKGSAAYRYYTEVLPSKNTGGVAYICSSQDMDPIPMLVDSEGKIVTDTGEILNSTTSRGKLKPEMKTSYKFISDYYNPEIGKKWEEGATPELRMQIREKMADEQIDFFNNMFGALANGRVKQEPLVLVVTNSIISKFKESHSFHHSQYGRLKQRIGQLCEEYAPVLEMKNIYVKNILLGVVDTPMWQRGILSQGSTARIVDALGVYIPMGGEEVPVEKPLDPGCVASSIRAIGESPHQDLPRIITMYTGEHLDIDRKKQDYHKKKFVLLQLIQEKVGDVDSIQIDDDIKGWLRTLRKELLEKYATDAGLQMRRFGLNMSALESILSKLPTQVSFKEFLNICYRIEGNFP